jgi:hypothetical protein
MYDDSEKSREIKIEKDESIIKRLAGVSLSLLKIPLVKYVIVLVMIVLLIIYGIKTKPELIGLSRDSGEEQVEETQMLVEEVGKIIELPEEVPTIATVTEIEKVREQKFFARAENGDKVLIFTSAKKAILYRPNEKKIIEVGVVNVDEEIQTQQEVEESTGSADIVTPTKVSTSTPTIYTPSPTTQP